MQSLNINQLVTDGLAPLSYASKHLVYRLVDMNVFEENSIDIISKSSIVFGDFSQQSLPVDNMYQILLTHSTFPNKSVDMLLRSALTSGTASFRRTLQDLKITHKEVFVEEINERDKHQNTLLWYLTMAGLYSSIEELYRLASAELDINIKNGLFNQTILHYAIIHGNFEEIRKVLDLGVDTNLLDRFGRTALHYIALDGTKNKNDIEIAKLLVDHGILPKYELYIRLG
jgi:ankyrin repeat protein